MRAFAGSAPARWRERWSIDLQHLQALVFDVDGTLYRQGPVRRAMIWRLIRSHVHRPAEGWSTLKALRAYRRAQETLRGGPACNDIAKAQLAWASDRTRLDTQRVQHDVRRWIELEPLDLVARSCRPGVTDLLRVAKRRGLKLGVFSDYPAQPKLDALGIAAFFDVVVTAQDKDVQCFKPDPRGLETTLRRLGVARARAIYIGDRPSVDGEAARRAGMPCVIVGRGRRAEPAGQPTSCADLARLIAYTSPALTT